MLIFFIKNLIKSVKFNFSKILAITFKRNKKNDTKNSACFIVMRLLQSSHQHAFKNVW